MAKRGLTAGQLADEGGRDVRPGAQMIGMQIGVSTLEDVQQVALEAGGQIEDDRDAELDALNVDTVIVIRYAEFGIKGLYAVECAFDASGVLVLLRMFLEFDRLRDVYGILSEKYTVEENRSDIGERYARLSAPGTVIEFKADFIDDYLAVSYWEERLAEQRRRWHHSQQPRELEKSRF